MLPIKYNTRKAMLRKINFDIKKISLLYAKGLFRRFDKGTVNRFIKVIDSSYVGGHIVDFDYKDGKYVEFLWKSLSGEVVIKVIRTNNNTYFVFERTFLLEGFYTLIITFCNIFGI